jgi:putative addiction module antidote
MIALKVMKIGEAAAVILPEEALELLKAQEGDTLFLTESPAGAILTSGEDSVEHDLRLAREVMDEFAGALRELAK